MDRKKFRVSVPEYNADVFKYKYGIYIVSEWESLFGSREFILDSPQHIYDEIMNLNEEGIEVVSIF